MTKMYFPANDNVVAPTMYSVVDRDWDWRQDELDSELHDYRRLNQKEIDRD